jgi:hypothetical protein
MSLLLGGAAGAAAAVAGYRMLAANEIRDLLSELRAAAPFAEEAAVPSTLVSSGRTEGEST